MLLHAHGDGRGRCNAVIAIDKVIAGAAEFAETEMLPTLPTGQMVVGATVLGLMKQRAGKVLVGALNHPVVVAMGLADSEGNIDVDGVAAALKESIHKHGKLSVDVPVMGTFCFDEANIDALVKCIKGQEE